MERRPVHFYSDGLRLDGDLYLPGGDSRPAVVACSGYQGLKDIHPARFARMLVPAGYVCLGFDYRGYGESEGPRGRLVPQEQVEDVRAAVSFLETRPEVDSSRIALLGWALGGGVVVAEAADDARVRAVVAVNAIGDGERSTRFMHDERSWGALLERVAADRRRRALDGVSQSIGPFEVIRLDPVTREYVERVLYQEPGFGSDVTLESVDLLLRFRPDEAVHRIAPRPLLLVHGAENGLHSPDEARALHRRAGDPKELVLLDGAGHTEWMADDNEVFLRLAELVRSFLMRSLRR